MNVKMNLIESIGAVTGLSQPVTKSKNIAEGGFQDAMLGALKDTSSLQKESGRLTKEFTLENPTVSLEQTMLVGVKSGIAFQATLQTRNRVVQAYTDIMNMQI